MKNIFAALFVIMITATSCITHNHYYYGGAAAGPVETIKYDRHAPDIRKPTMKKPATSYNAQDFNSFAVYTNMHTVAEPVGDSAEAKYAIWCTRKGTYLAAITDMPWNKRYFNTGTCMYLRDSNTGKRYPLHHVWGLPTDQTYWVQGVAGEWFCRVFEFPPLDPTCTHFDIIRTDCPPLPHIKGTTGWAKRKDDMNLSVSALQANQDRMKYKPTVVVK